MSASKWRPPSSRVRRPLPLGCLLYTSFYTKEGNFDIVGNQIPVFFIRDAMRFPEVIAALKPSPKNNLADPEAIWDFIARTPEAIHMVTWLLSLIHISRAVHVGDENYISTISKGAKQFKKVRSEIMETLKKIIRFVSVIIIPVGGLLFWGQMRLPDNTVSEAVVQTCLLYTSICPLQ